VKQEKETAVSKAETTPPKPATAASSGLQQVESRSASKAATSATPVEIKESTVQPVAKKPVEQKPDEPMIQVQTKK
jgi:hypothetical protein